MECLYPSFDREFFRNHTIEEKQEKSQKRDFSRNSSRTANFSGKKWRKMHHFTGIVIQKSSDSFYTNCWRQSMSIRRAFSLRKKAETRNLTLSKCSRNPKYVKKKGKNRIFNEKTRLKSSGQHISTFLFFFWIFEEILYQMSGTGILLVAPYFFGDSSKSSEFILCILVQLRL